MIFEGDRSVIDAIKEKKRLMDAGESHEHIRPLLIIDGGLMKGAYGVGAGLALEEFSLAQAFSGVVGVSSGAGSAAYFIGENVSVGASVIYEECCTKQFFNFWKFFNQTGTDYMIDVFQGSTGKSILIDRVLSSHTALYIGLSNFDTAEPVLFSPKNESELFDAIHASMLMPTLSKKKLCIDGVRYVDGGFTQPHIVERAVQDIDASHILILTNQNKRENTIPWKERFLYETLFRFRMSLSLRSAAHNRKKARQTALENMSALTDASVAVVWGDGSIGGLERDSNKVREVVEKSCNWWRELLK